MAGAEKLLEKILDEARLQAEGNLKRAEDEAERIIKSAQQEAEAQKADVIKKANADASDLKKRKIAVAGLECRKLSLKARQDIVEEAFSKALSKLCSMPQKEYEDMLAGLIISTAKTGNEEIILSSNDKGRLSGDFISRINNALTAKGIASNVKIAETGVFSGGFILKAGDIETNNSFEALIKMKHDELEIEVVKALL